MVKVSNAANIYSFTQQKEKFKKEAKRLFNLNNPHIVKVYDMFEENGTAYYVMEYIKGTSLANSINKSSKDELTVFSYLNQILDALSAIHTKNLWHLDIKPANILVSKGTIILIDFGASKHIDRNSTITTSSALAFTPGFAAPEQLQCDMGKFGPWTDFYALGATLYQIITLHTPPSFTDILSDGDTAFSFPEFISERMKHIILWMMKPNRRERPQNVDEISPILKRNSSQLNNFIIINKPKVDGSETFINNPHDDFSALFDENGIIWDYDIINSYLVSDRFVEYLNSHSELFVENISKKTNISIGIVLCNIGWLMKEGRLKENWSCYIKRTKTRIDFSFFSTSIENVYNALDSVHLKSLEMISCLSKVSIAGSLLSIGWLMKEGRVVFENGLIKSL